MNKTLQFARQATRQATAVVARTCLLPRSTKETIISCPFPSLSSVQQPTGPIHHADRDGSRYRRDVVQVYPVRGLVSGACCRTKVSLLVVTGAPSFGTSRCVLPAASHCFSSWRWGVMISIFHRSKLVEVYSSLRSFVFPLFSLCYVLCHECAACTAETVEPQRKTATKQANQLLLRTNYLLILDHCAFAGTGRSIILCAVLELLLQTWHSNSSHQV